MPHLTPSSLVRTCLTSANVDWHFHCTFNGVKVFSKNNYSFEFLNVRSFSVNLLFLCVFLSTLFGILPLYWLPSSTNQSHYCQSHAMVTETIGRFFFCLNWIVSQGVRLPSVGIDAWAWGSVFGAQRINLHMQTAWVNRKSFWRRKKKHYWSSWYNCSFQTFIYIFKRQLDGLKTGFIRV